MDSRQVRLFGPHLPTQFKSYRQGLASLEHKLSVQILSHSFGEKSDEKFRMNSLVLRLGISRGPKLSHTILLHVVRLVFVCMFLIPYVSVKPGREPSTERW